MSPLRPRQGVSGPRDDQDGPQSRRRSGRQAATGHERRDRLDIRSRRDGQSDSDRLAEDANADQAGGRPDGPILVTLVGDEPLAPLVLARQLDAARVICFAHPVVEWRIEPLLGLLRRDGRATASHTPSIPDVPAGLATLTALLALRDDDVVVFDLTNARGVLGIALYELAHRRELERPRRSRMVRLDWSDHLIRSISPDLAEIEPLRARISLDDYLCVHGKALLGRERTPDSPSPFGRAAFRLAAAIPEARPILQSVHRGGPERPLRLHGKRAHSRLVRDLVEDGVLEWRGSTLYATSMRAFQFLHGRWLEEYLFEVAQESGKFDDCASGVRFRWSFPGEEHGGEVANEIDFAGIANGRATIASCKTGGNDVNGPLYELLTLAERAAGRSVVTVFATTDTLDQPARRRAAALGVRTLDATRLPDPNVVLAALVNGGPASTTTPAGGPPGEGRRPRRPGRSGRPGR